MTSGLLLHTNTETALSNLLSDKPHTTLLLGQTGAGKKTIARYIAKELLGSNIAAAAAYYTEISSDKAITIEQIRQLTKFLQLKVPGTAAIRRVAVLVKADTMTIEAQNALLKLLEEPPADTMLLLTAEHAQGLLPTIRSRVQILQVSAPTKSHTMAYFSSRGYSSQAIERTYVISAGQIGLMTAVLAGGDDHKLAQDIVRAKELLQQTSYERLAQVDTLAKSKDVLPGLLAAFKRIAVSALHQAADKQQTKQIESWHERLRAITYSEAAMQRSANPKLLLTDLFIAL